MSGFSDHAESKVGTALLNGGTIVGGAVYVALFTSDPSDDETGTEVSDSAYARPIAHDSTVDDGFTESPTGTFSNANMVEFPPILDADLLITHFAVFDAPSDGNILFHGALSPAKTYEIGDIPRFPIGTIIITFA